MSCSPLTSHRLMPVQTACSAAGEPTHESCRSLHDVLDADLRSPRSTVSVRRRRVASGRRAARAARRSFTCGRTSRRSPGWLAALGIAIVVYGMPAPLALAAAANGAAFGLFPIGWIVLTRDLRLRHHRRDRPVRDREATDRRARRRPAHPGAAHRVQLRRVHRRRGRLRHAGRDLGGDADRPRLQAAARRRASR